MADKNKIYIFMDRLGVESVQSNPMGTIKFINSILDSKEVRWLLKPIKLHTDRFPEGHFFNSGGFLVDHDSSIINKMKEMNIVFDIVKDSNNLGNKLNPTKIALYNGRGTADFCIAPLAEVLDLAGFKYKHLSDSDIRKGLLPEFDILLVPGGPDAGESYYWGLGDKGYNNIKNFLYNNGQYFGLCAGAYLPLKSLSKENKYWLELVDATDDSDLDYWRTGSGFVRIKILDNTHPIVSGICAGKINTLDIIYWEGPAMQILSDKVKAIATFHEFIASGSSKEYPKWDLLDNTLAIKAINGWYNVLTKERFEKYLKKRASIVETRINKNKVILYSPHAEFGNIGITQRLKSQSYQLITNGLFYLSINE